MELVDTDKPGVLTGVEAGNRFGITIVHRRVEVAEQLRAGGWSYRLPAHSAGTLVSMWADPPAGYVAAGLEGREIERDECVRRCGLIDVKLGVELMTRLPAIVLFDLGAAAAEGFDLGLFDQYAVLFWARGSLVLFEDRDDLRFEQHWNWITPVPEEARIRAVNIRFALDIERPCGA